MKKIAILVTGVAWKPLGGLKVIYEYGKRLSSEGYKVSIYYSCSSDFGQYNIQDKMKAVLKYVYFHTFGDYKCTSWFSIGDISEKLTWKLNPQTVGSHDIYIATTLQSAYFLNNFIGVASERKFYFIQGFENWGKNITDEIVYESYKFKLNKIVIANWLKEKVAEAGEGCDIVYNGFNSKQYYISNPIEYRNRYVIAMMFNTKPSKGCSTCFEALSIVKNLHPKIEVKIFGIPVRPKELPGWYEYTQLPTIEKLRDLYNSAAIFIGASMSEGWGLTIGESMLCGCAVACTNNKGYLEMAKDGENALVSEVHDSEALASNINRLIEDDDLRCSLAKNGLSTIKKMTFDDSYLQFKKIILCSLQ